jgi:3-phenylpropionate/cinnamic acid dioxygenase small subunit
VTDEDAIRNTLARFCQALDDRRFEDWANTFTENGVFGRSNGRAAILSMIQGGELALQPKLRRKHTVTNAVIDVHGDTANVTSDLAMFDKVDDDAAWTIRVGRYTDELARQPDGGWLFTHRTLVWLD